MAVPSPDLIAACASAASAKGQLGRVDHGGVLSPCIAVCKMDAASQLCIGCYRTLDEIARWSRMDDGAKRAVWSAITQRMSESTP